MLAETEPREEALARTMMYVGGCNRRLPYAKGANAKGIAAFVFDERTGATTPAGIVEGIDNPTFLSVDPHGPYLSATSEVLGGNEGDVTTYAIDASSGALTYLNKQPSRGALAVHSCADRSGQFLFAVNYGVGAMTQRPNMSFVAYPRRDNGELGFPCFEAAHAGFGPNSARQERPHAHSVRVSPDNRFVIVADLGVDALVVYRFDATSGAIALYGAFLLAAGSGPRHFAFHPNRPFAYVVNELNSTLASLSYDSESGCFALLATASTLPDETPVSNLTSEIAIAPNGRHIYVANRGDDSIALLDVDDASGIAALVDTFACGGEIPRHIALDPSGSFLAVANQDSDRVSMFRVDPRSGALTKSGDVDTGTPTTIAFLRLA